MTFWWKADDYYVIYKREPWRRWDVEESIQRFAVQVSKDEARLERAELLTELAMRDDVMRGRPLKKPLRLEQWRRQRPAGAGGGWRTRFA